MARPIIYDHPFQPCRCCYRLLNHLQIPLCHELDCHRPAYEHAEESEFELEEVGPVVWEGEGCGHITRCGRTEPGIHPDATEAEERLRVAAWHAVNEYESHGGGGTHQECDVYCDMPGAIAALRAALAGGEGTR